MTRRGTRGERLIKKKKHREVERKLWDQDGGELEVML